MDIRRIKYKANRIKGMNITNAARAAGFSPSYCTDKAYRLERSVSVGILDELERAGLTDRVQAIELAKLAVGKDPYVKLNAWKHIADLKKQTSNTHIINNIKNQLIVFRNPQAVQEFEENTNGRIPLIEGKEGIAGLQGDTKTGVVIAR